MYETTLGGTSCFADTVRNKQIINLIAQLSTLISHKALISHPINLSLPAQRACALHTVPNLQSPNAATTDNPIGNGFPDLIALGTELPASTKLASSANSTP